MSQFFDKVNQSLQLGLVDMLRELYLLKENEWIDEALNIDLSKGLDVEVLERIARFYCRIRFYLDKDFTKIVITNVKESEREFSIWLIQFFYFLEAMELSEKHQNHSRYVPNKLVRDVFESKYASYQIDVSEKHFVFNTVEVIIKE